MLMTRLENTENFQQRYLSEMKPVAGLHQLMNGRMMRTVGKWVERSKQRRHLALLDDRLLNDIGISRRGAAREIAKPFWR